MARGFDGGVNEVMVMNEGRALGGLMEVAIRRRFWEEDGEEGIW